MSLILQDPQIHSYIAQQIIKARYDDHEDAFIDAGRPFERKYRLKMREVFAQQLDEIMTNLQAFYPKDVGHLNTKVRKASEFITMTFNYENVSHPPLHPHCRCTLIPVIDLKSTHGRIKAVLRFEYKPIETKALDDFLIDWTKYRIVYNEFGQLMLPLIMADWAMQEIETFELGISFDVLDPNVQSAIRARVNRFSDSVVNETRDQLHRTVNQSIQAGDGIPQLEKKIRLLYADMSKYRAVRIARTETIWGQNEGAEQSYIQSGVVEQKEWWTARDDRLCAWCAEMQGKRINVGQNYFNLGDSLTIANPEFTE